MLISEDNFCKIFVLKLGSHVRNWLFITNIFCWGKDMTHCKLFKMQEYMSTLHLTPCRISCILKPLHTLPLLMTADYVLCSVAAPPCLPALPVLAWFTLSPPAPRSVTLAPHPSLISADICLPKFNFVSGFRRLPFHPLRVHPVRLRSVTKG